MLLQMPMKNISFLFSVSFFGGILAALAHAASVGPQAGIKTLALPSVISVAVIVGSIAGTVISPFVIWSLNGKEALIAVPTIYAASLVTVVALNVIEIRFSMFIGFGMTLFYIVLYKFFGR